MVTAVFMVVQINVYADGRVPLDIYARRSSSSTIRSYMSFIASTSDLT